MFLSESILVATGNRSCKEEGRHGVEIGWGKGLNISYKSMPIWLTIAVYKTFTRTVLIECSDRSNEEGGHDLLEQQHKILMRLRWLEHFERNIDE